jgi:hypothetical protein
VFVTLLSSLARPFWFLLLFILFCIQIPPAPPRPDFDASREKLQKLGEGEGTMTKEEFNKMKQELEA